MNQKCRPLCLWRLQQWRAVKHYIVVLTQHVCVCVRHTLCAALVVVVVVVVPFQSHEDEHVSPVPWEHAELYSCRDESHLKLKCCRCFCVTTVEQRSAPRCGEHDHFMTHSRQVLPHTHTHSLSWCLMWESFWQGLKWKSRVFNHESVFLIFPCYSSGWGHYVFHL